MHRICIHFFLSIINISTCCISLTPTQVKMISCVVVHNHADSLIFTRIISIKTFEKKYSFYHEVNSSVYYITIVFWDMRTDFIFIIFENLILKYLNQRSISSYKINLSINVNYLIILFSISHVNSSLIFLEFLLTTDRSIFSFVVAVK